MPSSIPIYEKTRKQKKLHHIPIRYLPDTLNKSDRKIQLKNLKKSRHLYKKGVYFTRPNVKSFTQKKSNHIKNAKKMYNIEHFGPTTELATKTGCSIAGLKQIVKKGEGAYFSSGSRPGQTAFSWGIARLASALTGGPSSKIDHSILQKYCKNNSKPLKIAQK